ncbi:MAG: antitoxin VbhA family protein [Sporichthyaceae bacterium]
MAATASEPGEAERARRAETIRQVRHSTEMEGGESTAAARADQDAWARGEITEAQWKARIEGRQSEQDPARRGG